MAPPYIFLKKEHGILILSALCRESDALAYVDAEKITDLKILQDHTLHSQPRSYEMLRSLIQASPDLVYLSLSHLRDCVWGTALKRLQVLELSDCSLQNLFGLIRHAKNITTLRVSNLQDGGGYQGSSLPNLSKLEAVSFYGNVDHRVILSILQKAKNIKQIHLGTKSTLVSNIEELLSDSKFSSYTGYLTEKSRDAIALSRKLGRFHTSKLPTFHKKRNQFVKNWIEKKNALPIERDLAVRSKVISCETAMHVSPGFSVSRVFFSKDGDNHPCPSMERINAFSKGSLRKNPKSDEFEFVLERSEEKFVAIDLKSIWGTDNSKCDKPEQISIRAVYKLANTQDWQYLPSLSGREKLTHIYIEGMNENDVQIERGIHTHFYRIKINSPKAVEIIFNLQLPIEDLENKSHPEKALAYDLPQAIIEEIKYFQSFTQGALQFDKKDTDSEDAYSEALRRQQIGPCSTRAFLFACRLWEKYPQYPALFVENILHDYVEIQINHEWLPVNLGGYPAKINIIEPEILSESEDEAETEEEGSSEKYEDDPVKEITALLFAFGIQQGQKEQIKAESSAITAWKP